MKELLAKEDVMDICDVEQGKAYELIRDLNKEMEAKGFLTVRGKVNRAYLFQRLGIGVDFNAGN